MKLIDIEKLIRENDLLKLRLEEAHDWIKYMGDWNKYKTRSKNESKHSKSTRDSIKGNNNKKY